MIFSFSETAIRQHATRQSFERGQEYYHSGAVGFLVQRGKVLSAQVEGSEIEPYHVTIEFSSDEIVNALCTCPYSFEGWCKHIVATLLAGLHQPDQIEQRPELAELLAPLDRDQLQMLIQNLAETEPEWIEAIELEIIRNVANPQSATTNASNPSPATRPNVEPQLIERRVRRILARYAEQWDDEPALDEIQGILSSAVACLEQGDGNNALITVGAIARAYIEDWVNLDGSSGESGRLFEEIDEILTEAILSAEWSSRDRQQWQKEVTAWRIEVENYGIDSFAMSLTALEQGWEYPPLKKVLQGKITELGAWADEAPNFADDLAQIRLKILERQGRYQEYLYLSEAEGQTVQYLQMLVKQGQTKSAMTQAQQQLSHLEEAWQLAQTLQAQGALAEALHIAQYGLTLAGGYKYALAIWSSELAEEIAPAVALETRLIAFELQPSLSDYLKLKELAGEQWQSLRQDLLATLRQNLDRLDASEKAEIFLAEGLIEDAIAAVDQLNSYQSQIIHQVMTAAIPLRPDWVIENARRRAEAIMNAGQAQYYPSAIDWLRQVRAALLQLGQKQAWQSYHSELMTTHHRKRKLIILLQNRDLM